jgi:hypothetical protein
MWNVLRGSLRSVGLGAGKAGKAEEWNRELKREQVVISMILLFILDTRGINIFS